MTDLSDATLQLLRHLATQPGHTEVLADLQSLLTQEFDVPLGDVKFETVLETEGRIDGLVGRTVFEAKRNLDKERAAVERKMPDYLSDRQAAEGEPFVGVATDGLNWWLYELIDGQLVRIGDHKLDPDTPDAFMAWLDGAVALKASLKPDALTIRAELGQESVAWRRVERGLRDIWAGLAADPAQALKRSLWADLLKLVQGKDVDSDALWFQHTYLVVVAKSIALAVMDLPEDDPARMLSGDAFAAAGINGAVESDFFDWVVATDAGRALVAQIMVHVRRFRLREVESDVLKVLYESLIDRDERHGLGEYYTPDWLAAKVVRHAVDRPLEQKVLDPACGSGTFLFHAVRGVLAEAEDAGLPASDQAREACALVAGMDIHPVAVIIARVTYLLALAPALSARSGAVSVPVYLGDAMQLSVNPWMNERKLTIRVPPPPAGDSRSGETDEHGREQLDFPDTFCRDPALFDKAIEQMRTATLAGRDRAQVEDALRRITVAHNAEATPMEALHRSSNPNWTPALTPEQAVAITDLGHTYETFDRLRREGRDTIWSYVARNLSRPLSMSASSGWASVLVGNPPWVAFRHMSADLQKRFRELAKGERVYVGGKFATQNDLAALFTVRASHLYLRPSGTIAFVLPLAAMTRGQFEALRSGRFASYNIAWAEAWTMDDRVVPLFPVPSCVLFGRKRAIGKKVPDSVTAYSGWLPMRDAPEAMADERLTVEENAEAPQEGVFKGGSEYRAAFKQGAILVPRMLCMVERRQLGRLGGNPAVPAVVSRRSPQEKEPWRSAEPITGEIEKRFLRPTYLGENVAPFRVLSSFEAVIPYQEGVGMVSATVAPLLATAKDNTLSYDSIENWLKKVEGVWEKSRSSSTTLTFNEQLDYFGKLSAQFPIAPLRVVYAKAGTQPAACVIRDDRAIIDHMLYWSAPASEEEAHYLTAILNSETLRAAAAVYQARGQFGARHFDKVVFNLPIPRFSAKTKLHRQLADLGARAETAAAAVELKEAEKFVAARKRIRRALTQDGVAGEIDAAVERLLNA